MKKDTFDIINDIIINTFDDFFTYEDINIPIGKDMDYIFADDVIQNNSYTTHFDEEYINFSLRNSARPKNCYE